MKKIMNYFSNYFQTSSWFKILTDLIFYGLIVLMIIPGPRGIISERVIRATMFNPKVKKENVRVLSREDFAIKLSGVNGDTYNLSDFRGEVILINFWATWCPPCRAEMPSLQKLYDDYSEKMVFLFVAQDDVKKVDDFISANNYTIPVYYLRSAITEAFDIDAFPTTMVIDRNGGLLVKKKGAADWNSPDFRKKLNELIKED